jgi:hypothetical protein
MSKPTNKNVNSTDAVLRQILAGEFDESEPTTRLKLVLELRQHYSLCYRAMKRLLDEKHAHHGDPTHE